MSTYFSVGQKSVTKKNDEKKDLWKNSVLLPF